MRRTSMWHSVVMVASLLVLVGGCAKRPSAPSVVPATRPGGENDITVGAILPLTGDAAQYGQAARRGLELAIEKVNAERLTPAKMAVEFEDDQADPKRAVSAFQKLTAGGDVPAVIGAFSSSATLAIAPLAERKRIVLLSPVASAPAVTKAGDFIFRNVASDVFEGSIMPQFAYKDLGIRRVAVLYINNDFGVGLRDAFAAGFRALGGQIVAEEAFAQGATDFRGQLTKLKALKPEAVYLVGYKEMARVLRQSAELAFSPRFLSISMFEDPDILKLAGRAAEGAYYTYQGFDPRSNDKVIKDFVSSYRARYGSDPDIYAGLAYDAGRILALAIKEGGRDPARIRDVLYRIGDFPGVTGRTTFDRNGDVTKEIHIKYVHQGKFEWYHER